ncbi:MAG: ABC transporter ATP-binding protein [Pseudomonadota bacterium]
MTERARSGAAISLRSCAKTFSGGARALLPTDLEIATGEILALLGPSGCGKTTMLRIIAGLAAPDPGGSVCFDGEDVTAVPIERRRVGMVFQSYALFPNLTVRGNVGYGLRVQRVARGEAEARVAEVLALCRIAELADRRVTVLSGGQRQRVALARAVAVRPRALLLDEPLSALDAGLREALRDELAELLRRLGTTAVFVTHDQSEAMAIADRVAVLDAGRVRQLAPPRILYSQPADAFVARFVGGANALGGRVGEGRLHLPGGSLALPEGAAADRAVFVRPEAIALAAPEGASLQGTVRRALFLGGRCRLVVEGAAEGPLTVDAPGAEVPGEGSRVGLSIAPRDMLFLAPEADEKTNGDGR